MSVIDGLRLNALVKKVSLVFMLLYCLVQHKNRFFRQIPYSL